MSVSALPPNIFTDRSVFIAAVRQGIPGKAVQEAIRTLGERDLFIQLLDTTAANLSRFYHKPTLNRSASESILDTLRLFESATTVFEDREIAREWLHTANPTFNGDAPIDLFDTAEGRDLVRETLQVIEYGEFA